MLKRQPFFAKAVRFFHLVQEGALEGCVSPLICSNLFYILRRQLSREEARAALGKLRVLLRILAVDETTVDRALSSSFKDFEDAIQYYTALAHGLDAIVTRNKKDYTSAKLAVFTAEECVAAYEAQEKARRRSGD